MKQQFNQAGCLAAALVALSLGGAALASDAGHAAADQVSLDSYRGYLDTWLYTHNGNSRGKNSVQHDLARDNIKSLMEGYGLVVEIQSFNYSGGPRENVIGTKLGTLFPGREYIVGAHYDSVNNPGADDNASGVALFLECARILSQYDSDTTIRFIAFDVEEDGLIGSDYYVDTHYGDDIRGMISADMVAYDTNTNKAQIFGRSASNPIKNAVAAACAEYGPLSYSIRGQLDASDHAPFEAAGYQACLLIESADNPYYHTQQDSYDTANYLKFDFAVRMTRAVVGWLVDYAGVDVQLLNPGDLNCDGTVDFGDVNPFVLALTDPVGYAATFPDCEIMNADINGDGIVDFGDINAFVVLLGG